MDKFIWILLAFISGAFLPIQAGLNSRLGKSIESPVYASLISFVIGAVSLLLYIILTRQHAFLSGIKMAPAYVWIAGALGAFYVTVIILAFPRIGPALTFGLVVAGQMGISLFLDHFNILVAHPSPLSFWRVVGIVLVIGGVVLIRKF